MVRSWGSRVYLALIFLFLYAPIAVLMVFSFNSARSRGVWGGFTLDWYAQLFQDRQIMSALYYTLLCALLAAVLATALGTVAAIGLSGMRGLPRLLASNLAYLPMINPDIVMGLSLMLLFISLKIPLGFVSMLLAHITFCLPFVIFSVLPKLKQTQTELYDAALDLGATPLYAYAKVIIPQIRPGIVTGFLLAFTMSIDDFVVSFFATGNGVTNVAITIYSMARRGMNPKINALLTIMFAGVILLLFIANRRLASDTKSKQSTLFTK
ncbi:MAG: ABC transporter permease [Gracilibacteraceae bacterium]|jgi:spermidine/putrescine transport system permease protein|nr:ABC transporter permease [Gracilibacteraceae bacterium]